MILLQPIEENEKARKSKKLQSFYVKHSFFHLSLAYYSEKIYYKINKSGVYNTNITIKKEKSEEGQENNGKQYFIVPIITIPVMSRDSE